MTSAYGQYTILSIVDHNRVTEHCNVGALLFDGDGNNMAFRADTNDRAIRMGVLDPKWAETISILDFEQRLRGMQNVDQLRKTIGSMGHAMGMVQFREPYPYLIRPGDLESIFNHFVLGKP